jgi:hypothetical protein
MTDVSTNADNRTGYELVETNDIEMSNVDGNDNNNDTDIEINNVDGNDNNNDNDVKFTITEIFCLCIGPIIVVGFIILMTLYDPIHIKCNGIITGYDIIVNNELYYDGYIKVKYNYDSYEHIRNINVYNNSQNYDDLADMLRKNYPIHTHYLIIKHDISYLMVFCGIVGIIIGTHMVISPLVQQTERFKDSIRRSNLINIQRNNEHNTETPNSTPLPLIIVQTNNLIDPA